MQPPALEAPLPAAWRHALPADAAAPDLARWWRVFDDPLLDQLAPELLAQHLGLAQARLRLRQARALAQRDDGGYRPQLAAALRPVQDAAAQDTYYRSSLDASWELALYAERESTGRIATAHVAQALAEGQGAQVAALAELARQVILLRTAQHEAAAQERLRAIDADLLARARTRRELRLGLLADERSAAERLAETEAAAGAPRLAADSALQAIAALLGRTAPDPTWLAAPVPAAPAADFAVSELPADLLRTRADVRAAEAAVQQAAGEVGLARAELYPRLALGASIVSSYNVTQNRRIVNGSVSSLGPIIDIPLFDWGRRRANADARELALDAAVLGWRQTVVEACAEAETALATLAQARERGRLQATAAARAQAGAARAAALAQAGFAGAPERLLAERRVAEAEQAQGAQRYAAALAAVQLYKALGGAPPFGDDRVAAR